MRSVLGILKDREEPELCSPITQSCFRRGFPKQELAVAMLLCPSLWGCGALGEGRGSAAPGAAPGPGCPCSPLGAIPAAVAAQGAGLLLWLCLPCFNSTWELNSPWQPGHSWLQSLSVSRDTAPGAALAFHIPNSTPRTRHDFPSTVPDICIWSPF